MVRVVTRGLFEWVVLDGDRTVARFSSADAIFEALEWARKYREA